MATATADAGAATETVDAGTQGDSSSLQTEPTSAELAEQAKAAMRGESDKASKAVENTDTQAATDAASTEAEGRDGAAEGEESLETMVRDEKGRFVMRETRAKALFADRAKLHQIQQRLAEVALKSEQEDEAETVKENASSTAADPAKQADERVAKARADLQAAENEFMEASRDFKEDEIKTASAKRLTAFEELADAKADAKMLKAKGDLSLQTAEREWAGQVNAVEAANKEARETQWNEDLKRFPALGDPKGQMGKVVNATFEEWVARGDPLALEPDAPRLAVELAARRLKLKPEGAAKPTETARPGDTGPKAGQTQADKTRISAAAVVGAKKSTPPPSQKDFLETFDGLNSRQQIELLKKITADQARQKQEE